MKSMSDEFLVHVSEDGDYIEGLHPVRSQHIVNRLHECYLLEDTAYDVTKLADIKDFSVLFSHYPEYDFDKEKFYLKVVNKWWDCENLSCFVLALQGTFSGSVMQYFKQNESSFNDANEHSGLDMLAMDICPFTQFQEINESVQTLETMKDSVLRCGQNHIPQMFLDYRILPALDEVFFVWCYDNLSQLLILLINTLAEYPRT